MRSDGFSGAVRGSRQLLAKPATATASTAALIHASAGRARRHQHAAADGAQQDRQEGPAFDQRVAADQLVLARASCGRMLYFTGPNRLEWQPMQEQRGEQQTEPLAEKAGDRDPHDARSLRA